MKIKPKFHQQFYTTYFTLFFIISLLLLTFYALIKVREHKTSHQEYSYTQLQNTHQQLILLHSVQESLLHFSSAFNSHQFTNIHHRITDGLEQFIINQPTNNISINRSDIVYLNSGEQAQNVFTIKDNYPIAQALTTQVKQLIDTIDFEFSASIKLKDLRAEELFYLMKTDRLSDKNTALRATAYADLMNELSQEKDTLNYLHQLLIQFNLLDLHSNEHIIDGILASAENFFDNIIKSKSLLTLGGGVLSENVKQLKGILLIDNKLIERLYEHSRLLQQYLALIDQQAKQINSISQRIQIVDTINKQPAMLGDLFPSWLNHVFVKIGIAPSYQNIHMTLLFIMGVCLVFVVSLLFRFNRRVKLAVKENVNLVKACIIDAQQTKNTVDEYSADIRKVEYIEQEVILQLLNDLKQKNHAVKVNSSFNGQQLFTVLADFHQVYYWQLAHINTRETQCFPSFITQISNVAKLENNTCFRANFTAQSIKSLVACARSVMLSQQAEEVILETIREEKIRIVLHYSHCFYGSISLISDTPNIVEIQKQNALADSVIFDVNHNESVEELLFEIQNRLIQSMLKNQAEYVVKKVFTLSLHNQLNSLLSWVQGRMLTTQLEGKKVGNTQLHCLCLQTQILTTLANTSLEIKGQKVALQFCDKLPTAYHVDMDAELFNAAIQAVIHIMHKGQRNSHFMLTTELSHGLHQKNVDQIMVHYQLSLSTDTVIKQPKEISDLLNTEAISNFPAVKQLQYLFECLQVKNLTFHKYSESYTLSFDIEHIITAEQPCLLKQLKLPELTQSIQDTLNILYLTGNNGNKHTPEVIIHALSELTENIKTTESVEQALTYLSLEEINRQPIQLLLVDSIVNFQLVNQYVATLPKALQPKIKLLQGSCKQAPELSFGITNQFATPFNKQQFLHDILCLLSVEHYVNCIYPSANLLHDNYIDRVNADTKIERFIPTFMQSNIEVLIAIEAGDALAQLLQLMGFNLTFFSHENDMLRQWKTGKYLLLFSEFSVSPIIDLHNGKQVKRGVFSTDALVVEHWIELMMEQNKKWQIIHLPKSFTLTNLTEYLSPWLVKKEQETIHSIEPIVLLDDAISLNNTSTDSIDSDNDINEALSTVFDLRAFAHNLISSEFSVMMLSEYAKENDHLVEDIANAISGHSYPMSLKLLHQLLVNAKVLSAIDLIHITEQMIDNIQQQEYEQAQQLVIELYHEVGLIAEYNENL